MVLYKSLKVKQQVITQASQKSVDGGLQPSYKRYLKNFFLLHVDQREIKFKIIQVYTESSVTIDNRIYRGGTALIYRVCLLGR